MKKFAEFFAGIGLVRAGLISGGWHCAYAHDIEPKKREMYVDQFGDEGEYHLGDIWDIDSVLARLPRKLCLATASFPCTDLSLAGHWKGLDGKHSSTFFAFIDILRRLKSNRPPILLIENVFGFLKSNSGEDFARACRELAANGYWIDPLVIDAKWFVPQSRPRVFLVCVNEGLTRHALFRASDGLFGSRQGCEERSGLRPPILQRLIETIPLETGWLSDNLPAHPRRVQELDDVLDTEATGDWWTPKDVDKHLRVMQEPSRKRIEGLLNSADIHVGTAFRRTRIGKARTEIRFDIAGCLRTPRGGSARQIVVKVGRGEVSLRWMTPVEYARLQGIGDFNIRVPAQQAMFGFGDAVCVPAVAWLDQMLLTPLADWKEKAPAVGRGHLLST